MKKTLLIFSLLSCFISIPALSQSISGITLIPAMPDETDSIMILADCVFPSGSCDQHTQDFTITGNGIDAWALHCIGSFTVICPVTDTFHVGTLSAGTYIFTFQLDAGALPSPCTPGFIPGPNMVLTFEVSTPTIVPEELYPASPLNIFPNPATDQFSIELGSIHQKIEVTITATTGKIVYKNIATATQQLEINIKDFAEGTYVVVIQTGDSVRTKKIIITK